MLPFLKPADLKRPAKDTRNNIAYTVQTDPRFNLKLAFSLITLTAAITSTVFLIAAITEVDEVHITHSNVDTEKKTITLLTQNTLIHDKKCHLPTVHLPHASIEELNAYPLKRIGERVRVVNHHGIICLKDNHKDVPHVIFIAIATPFAIAFAILSFQPLITYLAYLFIPNQTDPNVIIDIQSEIEHANAHFGTITRHLESKFLYLTKEWPHILHQRTGYTFNIAYDHLEGHQGMSVVKLEYNTQVLHH